MATKFEISDLGMLTNYLGIKVNQANDKISIKQETYARKLLKEVSMLYCNPTQVPTDPGLTIKKDEDGIDVEATNYQRLVGCLRYLLHSRPDLSYAVGVVSRYMQSPKSSYCYQAYSSAHTRNDWVWDQIFEERNQIASGIY
jgi:hypothetical protein